MDDAKRGVIRAYPWLPNGLSDLRAVEGFLYGISTTGLISSVSAGVLGLPQRRWPLECTTAIEHSTPRLLLQSAACSSERAASLCAKGV